MESPAHAEENGSAHAPLVSPPRLLAAALSASAIFLVSAYVASRIVARSQDCIVVHGSELLLLGAAIALAIVATIIAHVGKWRHPLRQLGEKLEEIRTGQAPIEELSKLHGAVEPLIPTLTAILRELKQRQADIAQLEAEMRERVAQRTDALERTIGSLRLQTVRDPLTKLHNRRLLDECLPAITAKCAADKTDVTVLMMDLDNFKLLNDTLGHAAGDDLLRSLGQIIRSTMRSDDLAFRFGGDEFVILLPAAGRPAGKSLAARLASLVDSLGKTLRLSHPPRLSVGIVSMSELAGATPESLLAEADKRLYADKSSHQRKARQ